LSRPLASSEWNDAVAGIIRAATPSETAAALAAAIGQVVNNEGTCLLAFHHDAPPEVLHHTLNSQAAKHYLDRYLAGPYLLDPLYQLALRRSKPGICRYRDEAPDRFRSSEYYRQYCERTHLSDEMDFLVDVGKATALAMVVGRFSRRFTKAELARMSHIESIVHAGMCKVWESWPTPGKQQTRNENVHRRLTECFESFGDPVLTQRERETTQLLLRGFSTKAIARHLRIAPGTVMVHKRNLFTKLGISSQYELFSKFIETLSAG
jgi:DNA-binding CsgD family transcriptional regulator